MLNPSFVPRADFERRRGTRPLPAIFEGLWTAGSLDGLERPCVAVVGTRAASAYGKALARRFGSDLGAAGCCVISGLALGIDACAHEGALAAGAPTVGVLGGGHREFFPPHNAGLAERIVAAGGAVLSPYAPDEPAFPHQFLQRNGVVAALADAVVVIEAPARSGALNTAGWAAGRVPVFAVPGDVDRAHVAGCHALIRDGAILARSPQDVLDDMQWAAPPPRASRAAAEQLPLDPLHARIVQELADGELSPDDLCARLQATPAATLAALSVLELGGVVEARGARFALRR